MEENLLDFTFFNVLGRSLKPIGVLSYTISVGARRGKPKVLFVVCGVEVLNHYRRISTNECSLLPSDHKVVQWELSPYLDL